MRYYVDISNCKYITDVTKNSIVIDGKIYKMRVSKYRDLAATIPFEWLKHKVPCVLANRNLDKFIFSFDDDKDNSKFDSIRYIGERCTCYKNGHQKSFKRGGGYGRYIIPWTT